MHWDISYDSKSTGRACQDRHWTAGDAEGRPKPKEDSLLKKPKPKSITYQITNESQYQFGDQSYIATNPRCQSTMDMMEKLSTEQLIFKRRKEMKSMACCRPGITLTQSRNHSIAWICGGGSRCPTTRSANDYWLQDILYRTCGCSAQSSDSASAFELGKYNHLRETYVLGVYE